MIPVAVVLRSDKQILTSATCSQTPWADSAPRSSIPGHGYCHPPFVSREETPTCPAPSGLPLCAGELRHGVPGPLCLLRTLPPVEVGFVWWFVQACTAVTAGVSGLVACPCCGPPHPAMLPPRPPSPLHAVTPSPRARRKGVKSRDPSPSKALRLSLCHLQKQGSFAVSSS